MYDYLTPRNGPVVDGLEAKEIVYAKDQPEYIPLRTLKTVTADGRMISRWALTDEQRKRIAEGADIFLELLTFHGPLQPIRIAIGDGAKDAEWIPDLDAPSQHIPIMTLQECADAEKKVN